MTACISATSLCIAQDSDGRSHVQYVPKKAFAALIVYPKKMFMAKESELLPREIIQAFVQNETGIDPLEIEQFIGMLVDTGDESSPVMPALIIRCSERPQLSEQLLRNMEKGALKGKVIYRGEYP